MAKKKQKTQPNPRELEREIRRYIKRDGGFKKGLSSTDEKKARKLLEQAGRTKLVWDRSINLNMINTKSKVRAKVGKNTIDS